MNSRVKEYHGGCIPQMRGLGSHGNQVWPGLAPRLGNVPSPAPALGCVPITTSCCVILQTRRLFPHPIVHFVLSGVVFCLDFTSFLLFSLVFVSLPGVFPLIYSITDIFLSGRGCYLLAPPCLLAANVNFNQ
jgi:hypothetical protein